MSINLIEKCVEQQRVERDKMEKSRSRMIFLMDCVVLFTSIGYDSLINIDGVVFIPIENLLRT